MVKARVNCQHSHINISPKDANIWKLHIRLAKNTFPDSGQWVSLSLSYVEEVCLQHIHLACTSLDIFIFHTIPL